MPRKRIDSEDKTVQFTFRLPVKIREDLEILAKQDHRTLSQEIRWILQNAIQSREQELIALREEKSHLH
ncbi:MAG: hypothetical protein CL609_10890 [Anaerolineaceae bacterium]|nr:hypothetical protein [Anaerolineaceae bacterium]